MPLITSRLGWCGCSLAGWPVLCRVRAPALRHPQTIQTQLISRTVSDFITNGNLLSTTSNLSVPQPHTACFHLPPKTTNTTALANPLFVPAPALFSVYLDSILSPLTLLGFGLSSHEERVSGHQLTSDQPVARFVLSVAIWLDRSWPWSTKYRFWRSEINRKRWKISAGQTASVKWEVQPFQLNSYLGPSTLFIGNFHQAVWMQRGQACWAFPTCFYFMS